MRWYFHGHKVDFCQLLAVLLVVNIIQNMVYIQNDEKKYVVLFVVINLT